MNPGLDHLKPYPFERLAALRQRVQPAADLDLINLSIGEPQHPTPAVVTDALVAALAGTARYPATRGLPEFRATVAAWLTRRFSLDDAQPDPEQHVLPVNGTREALFAIAQTVVGGTADTLVGMPNPFYQIYEGAALLAGATPYFFDCPAGNGFRPDWESIPHDVWRRFGLVYVCSPGNPSGHLLTADDYALLTNRADEFEFVLVADECYSELYYDESAPPLGLLEWCAANGRADFKNCLVMHSLSKRSNAPGLRSGFVAGDASLIGEFYRYRTYHGGAMPLHVQHASIAAWQDEAHVVENRALYRRKFDAVAEILGGALDITIPPAGFYLWPDAGMDDIKACERLLAEAGVLTLPGQYLARDGSNGNPGRNRLRIALVADQAACTTAAERMRSVLT